MPIYEYRCPACKHVFELYFSSYAESQQVLVICPGCSAEAQRLFSSATPIMGGVEGCLRNGEKIRKRNEQHAQSDRGREEHRDGVAKAHERLSK